MFRRPRIGLIIGLCGALLFGQGLYMGGKAKLAQSLLDRAWSKTASTGEVHTPWAWMDAHPAARLTLEGDDRSHIVMNTDSGQALAFGPAIINGTDNTDLLAIAAHKNTQFQNLKNLETGARITLERPQDTPLVFEVTHSQVLDSRVEGIPIEAASETPSRIVLITCYPFNSVSFNGPMRYLVYAERVEPDV